MSERTLLGCLGKLPVERKEVVIHGHISNMATPTPCRMILPSGVGPMWLQDPGVSDVEQRIYVDWVGLKPVYLSCWDGYGNESKAEVMVLSLMLAYQFHHHHSYCSMHYFGSFVGRV